MRRGYAHTHANEYPDCYRDGNGHCNAYSYRNKYGHSHRNGYSYIHAYTNSDCYSGDADTNANSDVWCIHGQSDRGQHRARHDRQRQSRG